MLDDDGTRSLARRAATGLKAGISSDVGIPQGQYRGVNAVAGEGVLCEHRRRQGGGEGFWAGDDPSV